ncbi:hypothetical protein M431DRAFT_508936 [Trichoderma harzianum CBS 226.95]|uniref:Uncharacterized protein n=1 Tax=Trichoderma harzianum CBS 226.95 TaxID=983964 RepID=A0A2T4AA05_TRIHA|nr:hypothetical protein M431DRAFT_508936 [Trichoderma harzianum CBS 226.95]PTB53882.1 hypothetical protein M431DRAFT_508936 [Trichoderma harzianum CBS 226.95]
MNPQGPTLAAGSRSGISSRLDNHAAKPASLRVHFIWILIVTAIKFIGAQFIRPRAT